MHTSRKPLALYVHVPFCKAKCTYCDFYSIVGREKSIPAYLNHVLKEIQTTSESLDLSGHYIDTIFFGGGTPNLLAPKEMELLLTGLFALADAGDSMEIGMEVNPGEASLENLQGYKSLGINRMSIGMQSFQPQLLKFMSRIHSAEKSFSTYEDVRKAGFENVSCDLIFAVPGQTREDWEGDLKRLVSLGPEHISTYSLTVEEGTALHRWVEADHIQMLEDTIDNGMYAWGRHYLESEGYPNYEISNQARPGFHCRHNLNYWKGVEYLGFGPAAHSYFNRSRHWNVKNLDLYLQQVKASGSAVEEAEQISDLMARNEMILTRLRLAEGLDLLLFKGLFHEDLAVSKKGVFEKWSNALEVVNHHLRITPRGWALTDEISSDLMQSENHLEI